MHCHKCGAQLSLADNYCVICGAQVEAVFERLNNIQHPRHRKTRTRFFPKKIKIIFVLLLLGFGVYKFTDIRMHLPWQTEKINKISLPQTVEAAPIVKTKTLPSLFQSTESVIQTACEQMLVQSQKNKFITFPYQDELQIQIIDKNQNSWKLTGAFEQQTKKRKTKLHYTCYYQQPEKNGKTTKPNVAIMIN